MAKKEECKRYAVEDILSSHVILKGEDGTIREPKYKMPLELVQGDEVIFSTQGFYKREKTDSQ